MQGSSLCETRDRIKDTYYRGSGTLVCKWPHHVFLYILHSVILFCNQDFQFTIEKWTWYCHAYIVCHQVLEELLTYFTDICGPQTFPLFCHKAVSLQLYCFYCNISTIGWIVMKFNPVPSSGQHFNVCNALVDDQLPVELIPFPSSCTLFLMLICKC